MPYTTYQD